MLLYTLAAAMKAELPSVQFEIKSHPYPRLTIQAVDPSFGNLEVIDDGGELTVVAGRFTHGHFSCYERELSEAEKAAHIASRVLDFLRDTPADKVVFWGTHDLGGGWYYLSYAGGEPDPAYGPVQYLWSGAIRVGAA